MQTLIIIKKIGVAILILHKVEFRAKKITRDQGHFVLIKGSIYQKDRVVLNVDIQCSRTATYVKQKFKN